MCDIHIHTHTVQCFEQCGEGLYRENAEEINVENKFKRQEERESREGFVSQNLREETTSNRNSFEFYRADSRWWSCKFVAFDSVWPHGLQPLNSRLSCPSLSPRVCSHLCALTRRCYLPISSSADLFSFCFQSFPASRSFPIYGNLESFTFPGSITTFYRCVQWFPCSHETKKLNHHKFSSNKDNQVSL